MSSLANRAIKIGPPTEFFSLSLSLSLSLTLYLSLTLSLTHAFEPWSSLANGVVTSFHIQQKGCLDKILLYDKKEHCLLLKESVEWLLVDLESIDLSKLLPKRNIKRYRNCNEQCN